MNSWIAYLLIVLGIMLWLPLLYSRRAVSHRLIEATTIFGGAFLFAGCFINLVPHMFLQGYTTPGGLKVSAAVLVGFMVQLLIEQLTGGVEHGHDHHGHNDACHFDANCGCEHSHRNTLPLFGLMLGLCLHSFIEGIPLVEHGCGEVHQGLLYGIVLHNIPIVLVLISLFIANGTKRLRSLLLLLLFAVMTPLGSLCNLYFLPSDEVLQCVLMGVVVGILLHVSVSILFGENHNRLSWHKILLILVAFALAYFTPGCHEIY